MQQTRLKTTLVISTLVVFVIAGIAVLTAVRTPDLTLPSITTANASLIRLGSLEKQETADQARWASHLAKLEEQKRKEAAHAAWHAAQTRQARSSRTRPAVTQTRVPNAEIEACIIRVENGGDYGRSSNPTHFGRYQFSRSTWAANGGNPDTWGTASPEEQDRVFRNTVNRNGYSDWLPYNPC